MDTESKLRIGTPIKQANKPKQVQWGIGLAVQADAVKSLSYLLKSWSLKRASSAAGFHFPLQFRCCGTLQGKKKDVDGAHAHSISIRKGFLSTPWCFWQYWGSSLALVLFPDVGAPFPPTLRRFCLFSLWRSWSVSSVLFCCCILSSSNVTSTISSRNRPRKSSVQMLSEGGSDSTVICASSHASPSSLLSLQTICSLWLSRSSWCLVPVSDVFSSPSVTGSSQGKQREWFCARTFPDSSQ